MQLLRQPDAQPYEIVRLPENPLRHLTRCLSFLCVLAKILCVKYAVTPLNGNAAPDQLIQYVQERIRQFSGLRAFTS